MKTKTKLLIYLVVLCIVDLIIPVPITGLILFYVILNRPGWFQSLVDNVYGGGNDGRKRR